MSGLVEDKGLKKNAMAHSDGIENGRALLPGVTLVQSDSYVQVAFAESRPVLSSAILNGGYCDAKHFLNLRVDKDDNGCAEDPALTLRRAAQELGCTGLTVGMMTAASLRSLRVCTESIDGESLVVLVTSGLENARRAGDRADYRALAEAPAERGTINLAIITSISLAEEAMVEMVAVASEAKAAVLQELDVTSPVSGLTATGTGTDAIAVFGGLGNRRVRYAGKHTLLGERLAVLVMDAIRSSIEFDEEPAP